MWEYVGTLLILEDQRIPEDQEVGLLLGSGSQMLILRLKRGSGSATWRISDTGTANPQGGSWVRIHSKPQKEFLTSLPQL